MLRLFWALAVAWAATGRALRPVAEAEARECAFICTALHDLVTLLMAVTANCDVLEAEASDQAGHASWGRQHPCGGGRDGDSHRRHAHAHGRRLARAIPATGIIIREAFDCEARRCEGLSRHGPHRGTAMVATAPPEGLLASEMEPPWALAASEAAWRPSP